MGGIKIIPCDSLDALPFAGAVPLSRRAQRDSCDRPALPSLRLMPTCNTGQQTYCLVNDFTQHSHA